MASSPAAADENDGDTNEEDNGSKSYFQKAVCLTDWWLVKAENDSGGKRLAVGGFTLRHNVKQEFSSAPIEKVYDVFTLETMDGICILLKGLINRIRTGENGFPSKVFDHFVFGFPPNWESFAVKESWAESPPTAVSEVDFGLQKSSSCSQSVPEFRKTTRKNNNDASSAETHGPERKKNSKTKIGSKKGNQSEETGNKACRQKNMNKAEGPVLENGRGEASALSVDSSTSNDLRSGGLVSGELTQEYSKETIDNNLRGNVEKETPEGDNQKDGGVSKVVRQKNKSKADQSSVESGCAHSEKKKTHGNKKSNSVNASETPGKNRQNGVSGFTSPQSLSCKRSRSGRLLLPPLEFWRNQRAIYDADRRVTGIMEDPDLTM